jgi:hypothetical protein
MVLDFPHFSQQAYGGTNVYAFPGRTQIFSSRRPSTDAVRRRADPVKPWKLPPSSQESPAHHLKDCAVCEAQKSTCRRVAASRFSAAEKRAVRGGKALKKLSLSGRFFLVDKFKNGGSKLKTSKVLLAKTGVALFDVAYTSGWTPGHARGG